MEPAGLRHSLRGGEGKVLTARLKTRDMELSLPLVVDEEVDAFVERVGRERFKGRGKDDSAERRTIRESVFFDRFNSLSQSQLFESGTFLEGPPAYDFD